MSGVAAPWQTVNALGDTVYRPRVLTTIAVAKGLPLVALGTNARLTRQRDGLTVATTDGSIVRGALDPLRLKTMGSAP